MAEHGFFGHESYDGSAFWHRIKPMYKPMPAAYWGAGENMVWASPEPLGRAGDRHVDEEPAAPQEHPHPELARYRHRRRARAAAPGVYQGLGVTIVTADFGVR